MLDFGIVFSYEHGRVFFHGYEFALGPLAFFVVRVVERVAHGLFCFQDFDTPELVDELLIVLLMLLF